MKSIALNDRGYKLYSDIRTFRTASVFCLYRRLGRSCIDRVKGYAKTQTSIYKRYSDKEIRICSSIFKGEAHKISGLPQSPMELVFLFSLKSSQATHHIWGD
ncbi:hypothetical protein AVEN_187089-1 [Araneus ventricosus]|uniref:Uncharacterized protein n=1 Tax=Araneus ventricosus TaxID=182803 RepID=A0A4Y2LLU5_ARAVE|nr:hypothetical protein AVEN_187089-1 [Araneus ventricosus]